MDELKAINTFYNGNYYRSRLEARWAVFFDEIGIEYEYENEGYDLDGLYYLPDFWFPKFNGGCFGEVKPTSLNNIEKEKANRLVYIIQKPLILFIGRPNYKCQEIILFDECNSIKGLYKLPGLINILKAKNRIYFSPGFENDDLSISTEYHYNLGESFINAVIKARSARF